MEVFGWVHVYLLNFAKVFSGGMSHRRTPDGIDEDRARCQVDTLDVVQVRAVLHDVQCHQLETQESLA